MHRPRHFPTARQKVVYPFLEKVERLLEHEKYDAAERMLKKYLQQEHLKSDVRARVLYLLGQAQYSRGHYQSAARYLEGSLRLDPALVDAAYLLSTIAILEERIDDALFWVRRCLRMKGDEPEFLRQYAWILISGGQFEEADAVYDDLLENHTPGPETVVDAAMNLILKKDFDKARKIIYKGIGKYGDDPYLDDALFTVGEAEMDYSENRKEFFFKNLFRLHFQPDAYRTGLRKLVEGMTLRGYVPFEIEKATSVVILLQATKTVIPSPEMLAALCELIIADFAEADERLPERIARSFEVDAKKLQAWRTDIMETYAVFMDAMKDELETYYEEAMEAPIDDDL